MQIAPTRPDRRRTAYAIGLALLALFTGLFGLAAPLARAAWLAPLRSPINKGIVAADTAEASRAGAEILARGGNAVDAAVATALALGVTSPASSGLGGGGFLIVWNARTKSARVLDFRETAPAAATRDMFVRDGKAVPEWSREGGLAVAVPGEAAGLAEIEKTLGKLGLAAAAQPAVRLARDGFTAGRLGQLEASIGRIDDPLLNALLAPKGHALTPRDRVRWPELGATIERFGKGGAAAFYRGPIASALVASVRAHGGLLTEADLAAYQPLWREPLVASFRGHQIYGPPPPAGGVTALETLQILDARPPLTPLGAGSSAADHVVVEALKHAFADRARALGDPAFVAVPTARFVDPVYTRALAGRIDDAHVQPKLESYGDKRLGSAPTEAPRDHGTSNICVVDGEGNMVALTTTVNLRFGAKFIGGSTGVVLNDEMDDFSAQPGAPNAFGLVGGLANAVAPGKRPLSSMTPLIVVKDGRAVMCAGASGGPMIVSATVQTIVNVIDHGMDVNAAVSSPRLHAQWLPDLLFFEKEIAADVLDGLRRRGHQLAPMPDFSAEQAIVVKDGWLEAASDPRKGGSPAAP